MKRELLTVPVIVVFSICLHWQWYFNSVSWADHQDNTNLFLPVFTEISNRIASGDVPTVLFGLIGGLSLDANPHFSYLYPLYFLYIDAFHSAQDAAIIVHRIVLLHNIILLVNMYILGRCLRLSSLAAAISALAFAHSFAVQTEMPWVTHVAALAWLPLLLAGLVLILRGDSRTGFKILVPSAVLLFLAQPSQYLIIAVLLGFFIITVFIILAPRSDAWRTILICLWAGAVLVFILGPNLVLLSEFHANSIRWIGEGYEPIVGSQHLPAEVFAKHGFEFSSALDWVFLSNPHVIVGHIYLGPLLGMLGMVGVCFACIRRDLFWRICSLGWIVFTVLTFSDVATKFNLYIPLLNKIREVTWLGVPASLFGFLLSGYALDVIVEKLACAPEKRRKFIWPAIGFFILLLLWAGALQMTDRSGYLQSDILAISLGTLITVALYIEFIRRHIRWARYGIAACVFIGSLTPLRLPRKVVDSDAYSQMLLEKQEVLAEAVRFLPNKSEYKIDFPHGESIDWTMQGMYFGIRSFQGKWQPQNFQQFTRLYWIVNRSFAANAAGVRFRLREDGKEIDRAGQWSLVGRLGRWILEENFLSFPRVFEADEIAGSYSDDETYWSAIATVEPKPRQVWTRLVDKEFLLQHLTATESKDEATYIRTVVSEEEHVRVVADLRAPRLIVLNDYAPLGWRAYVDGRKSSVVAVNLFQPAVAVGVGNHVIDFRLNTPDRILLVLWPLVSSIGLVIVALILSFRRRLKAFA